MEGLINMAREPKSEDEKMDCCIDDDNKYPWGLRIHLREEEIEKLGLTEMPDAGDKILVTAMVSVAEVGQRETKDGTDRNMQLQITDIALGHAQSKLTDEEVGKKIYDAES